MNYEVEFIKIFPCYYLLVKRKTRSLSYVGYGSSASGIRVSAASTDFLSSSISERTTVWYAFALARGSSVASALAVSAFKVSRPVEISSASCDSSLISFPSEAVLTSETTEFFSNSSSCNFVDICEYRWKEILLYHFNHSI